MLRPVAKGLIWLVFAPRLTVDRRVRKLRGRVVVPNHPSVIDPILLFAYLPPGTWFAATEKMVHRYPILRLLGLLPVCWLPADGLRKRDWKALIRHAQEGSNLVIFPQADVALPGSPFVCYSGFWRIAQRAERRMSFVAVVGTHATMDWENSRRIGRRQEVELRLYSELEPKRGEVAAVELFHQMLEEIG